MRKFIIQSGRGKTSVMEVECEIITAVEDPSVLWLEPGEYRARVVAPATLKEKDGKAPIWYSYNFSDDLASARKKCESFVRGEFEFNLRKYGTEFTEEEVQKVLSEVETVML